MHPIKPKHQRKDHPPQVPTRPDEPAQNPVRMREHMRHNREIRTIRRIDKERQAGNQPKHGHLAVCVQQPDGEAERALADAEEDEPELLG